jgi:hypothetical protein
MLEVTETPETPETPEATELATDPGPLRLDGQWYRTEEFADGSGEVRSSGSESLNDGRDKSRPSGMRLREPFLLYFPPSIRAATAAGDGDGGGCPFTVSLISLGLAVLGLVSSRFLAALS